MPSDFCPMPLTFHRARAAPARGMLITTMAWSAGDCARSTFCLGGPADAARQNCDGHLQPGCRQPMSAPLCPAGQCTRRRWPACGKGLTTSGIRPLHFKRSDRRRAELFRGGGSRLRPVAGLSGWSAPPWTWHVPAPKMPTGVCGLMDQFASANGVEGYALYFDTRSLGFPGSLPGYGDRDRRSGVRAP
jgi:hypothetical protein